MSIGRIKNSQLLELLDKCYKHISVSGMWILKLHVNGNYVFIRIHTILINIFLYNIINMMNSQLSLDEHFILELKSNFNILDNITVVHFRRS